MEGVDNKGFRISVIDLPSQISNNKDTEKALRPVIDYEVVSAAIEKTTDNHNAKKPPHTHILILGLSELMSTALLMFMGCMGCVAFVDPMPLPRHFSCLSFGLVIMIMIWIFGHISGAHMNPAVTLASVYLGLVKPIVGVVYVAAQFIGAIMGFSLLKIMIPTEYVATDFYDPNTNETYHKLGLCSTVPSDKINMVQSVMMESILTCVLIMLCCAVWDPRNAHNTDSTPLRFGLAVAGIGMIGGPYTGASMNTARSFAPALLNSDWNGQWIYWVGPNVGGLFGAIFYKIVFGIANQPDGEKKEIVDDVPLKETAITRV